MKMDEKAICKGFYAIPLSESRIRLFNSSFSSGERWRILLINEGISAEE